MDNLQKEAEQAVKAHVPTINTPVVTEEQLRNTLSQLDAAISDILEAGERVEDSFQDKMEFVGISRSLETEIQIVESEAIMAIEGTGKTAYGMVEDDTGKLVKVFLSNDTQRDAYRRHFSAKERKELARVEGRLKELDVLYLKAKENYNTKVEALAAIRAKAALQAAYLNYLA